MGAATNRLRIVYLAGHAYCGSTLTTFLLNMHPEVVTTGEVAPPFHQESPEFRCSCGALATECAFFAAVGDGMRRLGVPFDPGDMRLRYRWSETWLWNRLVLGPFGKERFGLGAFRDRMLRAIPYFGDHLRELGRRNVAFYRACIEVTGRPVFLDASKLWRRLGFLLELAELDLKVIFMPRDPRGWVVSSRKHDGYRLAQAARYWNRTIEDIEHTTRDLGPDRLLVLRYEDLTGNPGESMARVTDFIGIAPLEIAEDYRSAPHHIIGNPMRESTDTRRKIRLDERWREELSEDEQRQILAIAGEPAIRYGYRL